MICRWSKGEWLLKKLNSIACSMKAQNISKFIHSYHIKSDLIEILLEWVLKWICNHTFNFLCALCYQAMRAWDMKEGGPQWYASNFQISCFLSSSCKWTTYFISYDSPLKYSQILVGASGQVKMWHFVRVSHRSSFWGLQHMVTPKNVEKRSFSFQKDICLIFWQKMEQQLFADGLKYGLM